MENVFKKSMEFPWVFAHMESTWFRHHGFSVETHVIATMGYPWSLNGISIENPWLKPR